MCRSDTSDSSEAASVKKIRKRANRGDANAMYNLGGYYDSGDLVLYRIKLWQEFGIKRQPRKEKPERLTILDAVTETVRVVQSIKLKLQSIFEWRLNWDILNPQLIWGLL